MSPHLKGRCLKQDTECVLYAAHGGAFCQCRLPWESVRKSAQLKEPCGCPVWHIPRHRCRLERRPGTGTEACSVSRAAGIGARGRDIHCMNVSYARGLWMALERSVA